MLLIHVVVVLEEYIDTYLQTFGIIATNIGKYGTELMIN